MHNSYFKLFGITQWVSRNKFHLHQDSIKNNYTKSVFIESEKKLQILPTQISRKFSFQIFESKNAIVVCEVENDSIVKNTNDFNLLKDICLFFQIEDLQILPTLDFPLQGTTFSFQNAHDLIVGILKKFSKNKNILFGENVIYFYLGKEFQEISTIGNNILLPCLSKLTEIENKKLLNKLG